jgi:hypothetical protein
MKRSCHYPYGHRKCDLSYSCYLRQCKAYGFAPLDEKTWSAAWQKLKPPRRDGLVAPSTHGG